MELQALKKAVLDHCLLKVNERIEWLKRSLSELTAGAEVEMKSSAGDKHETARAMMQLEQEKLMTQLGDVQNQKQVLEKIIPSSIHETVHTGSLVVTNKAILFFAVAMGRIKVNDVEVMVISVQSPAGGMLRGCRKGDKAVINKSEYTIEDIA